MLYTTAKSKVWMNPSALELSARLFFHRWGLGSFRTPLLGGGICCSLTCIQSTVMSLPEVSWRRSLDRSTISCHRSLDAWVELLEIHNSWNLAKEERYFELSSASSQHSTTRDSTCRVVVIGSKLHDMKHRESAWLVPIWTLSNNSSKRNDPERHDSQCLVERSSTQCT